LTLTRVEIVELVDRAVAHGSESARSNPRVPILPLCVTAELVNVDADAFLVIPNLLWKTRNAAVEAEAWVVADALSTDVIVEFSRGTWLALAVARLEEASARVIVPEETWWALLGSADAFADS